MARHPDPRQTTLFEALDAAPPHRPGPAWWYDTWRDGDPVPPGWYPPRPDDEYRKPRRVSISTQPLDLSIIKTVEQALAEAWYQDRPDPFTGTHETVRHDDCVVACLEAFDGGLAEVRVRGEPGAWTIHWQYVPGASADEHYSGLAWCPVSQTWWRLPANSVLDEATGDHIPSRTAEAA